LQIDRNILTEIRVLDKSRSPIFYATIKEDKIDVVLDSYIVYNILSNNLDNLENFKKELYDKIDCDITILYGTDKKNLKKIYRNKSRYKNREKYIKARRCETIVKYCKNCNKKFETSKKNKIFCCRKCKNVYNCNINKHLLYSRSVGIQNASLKFSENKNKKWTKEELDYIIENRHKMTIREIAFNLKRSFYATKLKVCQIMPKI